jgi:hypothetical protein
MWCGDDITHSKWVTNIGHLNWVWAFSQFGCNIGDSGGVIISPTKNGSQISGTIIRVQVWAFPHFWCNIFEFSWVIMLPTKNGSQILGTRISIGDFCSNICESGGAIMSPTKLGNGVRL